MTLTEFLERGAEAGVEQWCLEVRNVKGLREYHVSGWVTDDNYPFKTEGFSTKFKIDVTFHGQEIIV
jgi:hypothetical protein